VRDVNGGIRRVAAGSVVLVEDTTGKATFPGPDLAVNDALEKPAALVAAQDRNDLLWPAGGISELIRKWR
jgi:hypothetical protein